jgi:HEPN domain-containing protein
MLPEDVERASLTRQWLTKASRDLQMADRALGGTPQLRDMAAFHCQQAAEKAVKAFLVWRDQPFRRTHDIQGLVRQCNAIDPAFGALQALAGMLTPYVGEYRYPGDPNDPLEPSPDEALQARQLAQDAYDFVRLRLPIEVTDQL